LTRAVRFCCGAAVARGIVKRSSSRNSTLTVRATGVIATRERHVKRRGRRICTYKAFLNLQAAV
jgi:hypothetical protein